MNNYVGKFRNEKGLTQLQLATLLEVSRQTIISIESGRYNPSLELAFAISKLFDKKIEEIFICDQEGEQHE